jgi:hypothetical protein
MMVGRRKRRDVDGLTHGVVPSVLEMQVFRGSWVSWLLDGNSARMFPLTGSRVPFLARDTALRRLRLLDGFTGR